MWKYIVTWCIVQAVPCDRTTTDEFGRKWVSATLEYCVTYENECDHKKEFLIREKAFEFYDKALDEVKTEYTFFKEGSLVDVKIDSILITE